MATEPSYFDLPTDPDQFSVLLPPSELRKIDFSALEFATARRALVEYIKTYFPDDFNDFVSNNGVMMLVELTAYVTAVLSLRSDMLTNEAFLPTATTEDAVINHLALIGQKMRMATPAVVDIECSVPSPVSSDIHIESGQRFAVAGEDGNNIIYEMYRSPSDFISDIVIPSGKRGVIAYGVEGRTDSTTAISTGDANQSIVINTSTTIIGQPTQVLVTNGDISEEWNRVDYLEKSESNDQVYEVRFFDRRIEFVFGDNKTGKIPLSGSTITCTYRLGGGSRGRIGAGVINEQRSFVPNYPYVAPVIVSFRNVTPSSGGVDKESLIDAKKRAPRDAATHNAIVTSDDYAQLVGSYSHPVFGSIAKAVATVRTGLNANLVELYVLADGADGPVGANEGLKRAVASYVDELNVLTDSVSVLDASLRPVDVEATIVVNRSSDASVIKGKVEQAITDFFNITNWDLGEALYVSDLYDILVGIDGVKYVDIFKPADNILATGVTDTDGDSSEDGININELISLGNKEIKYYYEAVR
jgi:uncharacterized phage protein gp47/JayE